MRIPRRRCLGLLDLGLYLFGLCFFGLGCAAGCCALSSRSCLLERKRPAAIACGVRDPDGDEHHEHRHGEHDESRR
jgi:hypothetical protein